MFNLSDITITRAEAEHLGILNGLGLLSEKTVFKNINEKILAELKKGNLIFRKSWRDGYKIKGVVYGAHNYVSANPYQGANAYMINLCNLLNKTNYQSFLTPKQIKERGGTLSKNAPAFPVWAFIKGTKTVVDEQTNEEYTYHMKGVVSYLVYPIEFTENVKPIKRKETEVSSEQFLIKAETIIANMPKAPDIKKGGDRAYYSPSGDYVQMPHKAAFNSLNEYYSVLFHELVHSTGHKKRIGRDLTGGKGTTKYALEELIAELGAAYLCGITGIDYYTINNSAAYLKSWSSVLQKEINANPRFLLRAVYSATKSAKYIIGETIVKTAKQKNMKKQDNTLGCNSDFGFLFIKEYAEMHGKTITANDIEIFIDKLAMAISKKQITKAHPYKKEINDISSKLYNLHSSLGSNESIKISISNLQFYKNILEKELSGLGFIPFIIGAAAGKLIDHFIEGKLKKATGSDSKGTHGLSGVKKKFPIKVGKIGKPLINNAEVPSGNIYLEKGNSKFGFEHILKRHSKELKLLNLNAESFAKWLCDNYTHIYYQPKTKTHLVVHDIGKAYALVMALKSNNRKNYFTIITEGARKSKELKKYQLVWKRTPNPVFPPTGLGSASMYNRLQTSGNHRGVLAPKQIETSKNKTKILKTSKSSKSLEGVMTVTQAINSKFDLIGLDGDYLKLIGKACKPTSFFIFGPGGSGKSTLTIKFANYLSQRGNKILYVAGEQFGTPIFSEMLTRLKIVDSPNFVIVKNLDTMDSKGFDFIAIDSKDSLNFELEDFKQHRQKHPKLSYIILSQATKDGGFTGSEKWRNEVDTIIYCENLIAYTNRDKNRWGGSWQKEIFKIK